MLMSNDIPYIMNDEQQHIPYIMNDEQQHTLYHVDEQKKYEITEKRMHARTQARLAFRPFRSSR